MTLDLIVAGGGPAGLSTAILAARAGLRVEVREPRVGPIDKACGEGLMPGAVAALADLGVTPSGRPFHGIRYLDGTAAAEARFARGPGLGVRRTTLHAALAERARELGVHVEPVHVREVRQHVDHVDVDGSAARYLVAADGLHSPIRRSLGLSAPPGRADRRRTARYGITQHFTCAPWTDLVEVHWGARHEAYVTPVAPDLVGVAVLGPRGSRFDNVLAELPTLRERLRAGAARPVGQVRGAGPLLQGSTARVAGRVLLVGDAGGYLDALTGEGVRLALAEAAAAVAAITNDAPSAYEADWRRIGARHRHGTRALVRATAHGVVRRHLVPVAARLPRGFAACVNALG